MMKEFEVEGHAGRVSRQRQLEQRVAALEEFLAEEVLCVDLDASDSPSWTQFSQVLVSYQWKASMCKLLDSYSQVLLTPYYSDVLFQDFKCHRCGCWTLTPCQSERTSRIPSTSRRGVKHLSGEL